MHPILKNIRSLPDNQGSPTEPGMTAAATGTTSCGIASRGDQECLLREAQREDRIPKPAVPAVDLFRDSNAFMTGERDLMYQSSNQISLDPSIVEPEDFVPDEMGSRAQRHMEACKLRANGQHTRDIEKWQHDTFQSRVKQMLYRHHTPLGALYLSDFLNTFVDNPPSHGLTMQLITLVNHVNDPTLKRFLKDIASRDSEGKLKYKWLLNLVNIIDMIFRDEATARERLTALLTVANQFALCFSKKANGGMFPSTDQLSKTHTFFRRIILGLLSLAESIGCYSTNHLASRPQKRAKVEVEPSDDSYMFSLKGALEAPESDEEDEDSEESWTPA